MSDAPLTPYDWQQADIDKIIKNVTPKAGALVVSAPGAGKTLVAVESMKHFKPEQTIIIAPPSTHETAWAKTLRRQGVADEVLPLLGTKAGKRNWEALKWGKPGIYITSTQWFTRTDWDDISADMVIFDEIHMATRYGNVGQKKLLGTARKRGLWAPIRLALSGTPFRNNFENAWSLVRWVEPSKMTKDYWFWRVQDTAGKYDHFAPQNWKVTGEPKPGALFSTLSCFIVHYQRERCCKYHPNGFLAALPEPVRLERDLDMTTKQATFYHEMEKNFITFLTTPGEDGKIPVVTEFPIAARGMLRFCALGLPSYDLDAERLYFDPKCESPKIEALIADMRGMDGKRILVLTHSAQFVDVVVKRLQAAGFAAAGWKGGVSSAKRRDMLAAFQSGELDAIVGVISAMGTGTDGLQEATWNVAWLSVDDDPSNVVQGISRLDRLGQKHRVTMIVYRMRNTFDVGHLDKQITRQLELNKSLKTGAR